MPKSDFLSNLKRHNWTIDIVVFIVLFCVFFTFAVLIPKLPDFDFFNYKWYNALAYHTNRYISDFMATGVRTCFSPIIDLPLYYLLLKLNNHPILIILICCFDVTILFFLLYKIIKLVLKEKPNSYILAVFFFSSIFVASSPSFIIMSGVDGNDIVHSVLSVFALYIFLRFILNNNYNKMFLCSLLGFLVGAAFGLKLVAISYVLTFPFLLLIFKNKLQTPFKNIILYSTFAFFAFTLLNGNFLLNCYEHYKNPFYPYFNHIFQSPYSDIIDMKKIDYSHICPKTIFDYIFYCFINEKHRLIGLDNGAWDFRMPISFITNFILVLIIAHVINNNSIKNTVNKIINFDYLITLVIFVVLPFAINTFLFGTYRYIIASILFFGFLLFILLSILLNSCKYKSIIIPLLCSALFFCSIKFTRSGCYDFVKYKSLNKVYSGQYITLNNQYYFNENSTIILLTPISSLAISPSLSKNIKVIGYYLPSIYRLQFLLQAPFSKSQVVYSEFLENQIQELINSDKKIYIVYAVNYSSDLFLESLKYYNKNNKRKLEKCKNLDLKVLNTKFGMHDICICEYN